MSPFIRFYHRFLSVLVLLAAAATFCAGTRALAQQAPSETGGEQGTSAPEGGTPYCQLNGFNIPDNDPNGVTNSQVIGGAGTIQALDVSLVVNHTWVGDLRFTLTHQDTGTSVTFFDRPGVPAGANGCSGNNLDVGLDDEATLPVEDQCGGGIPTINGVYTPNNPLRTFDGENIAGTWTLTASDHAGGDTGNVDDWCIYIVPDSGESANLTIVKDATPADGTDFYFTGDLGGPSIAHRDIWGSTGTGNGQFDTPLGMAVDTEGYLYVADGNNDRVQKFDANGNFLLAWGSSGTGNGQFNGPRGIVVDNSGYVYVVDKFNHRVQIFDGSGNYITQWGSIGSGNGQFNEPIGIAQDTLGNFYVVDSGNDRIQKFDSSLKYLTQWGGPGTLVGKFLGPTFIAVDGSSWVYVADTSNQRVQRFDTNGNFSTLLSNNFLSPVGVELDEGGNVYITDAHNHRVQKFDNTGNFLSMWGWGVQDSNAAFQICTSGCQPGLAGNGDGQFNDPEEIAIANGKIYVSNTEGDNIQVFATAFALDDAVPDDGDGITNSQTFSNLFPGTYQITETLSSAGWSLVGLTCDSGVWSADLDSQSLSVTLSDGDDVTCTFTNETASTSGASLTIVKDATPADGTDFLFTSDLPDGVYLIQWGSVAEPYGVAVDAAGNVFVADGLNNRVQKFSNDGTYLTQWGSNGSGDGQFDVPLGITVDAVGNVYVVDQGNNRVQKFNSDGAYLTQWGGFGSGDGQFTNPGAIAVDMTGNVYVVDPGNDRVQKFSSDGTYLTQWGSNGSGNGQFDNPTGVAIDTAGNVFVADEFNHRIQKFNSDGTYLTQWGDFGSGNGQFIHPWGIAVDAGGNVFLADRGNARVQKFATSVFALDDAVPDDNDSIPGSRTFTALSTGTYHFTETLPDGWALTGLTCDSGVWSADLGSQSLSITLAAGDDVTCTFTNVLGNYDYHIFLPMIIR